MDVVYGMRVADENDKYVNIAEKGAAVFSEVAAPGRFLAELFPSLAYVPAWLPGAQFKRDAAKWERDMTALRDVPWDAAVNTMVCQCMLYWWRCLLKHWFFHRHKGMRDHPLFLC